MVIGIGTDMFEVKRMKDRLKNQPSFSEGIYTIHEIEYCEQFKNKAEHYAARYAAKEAFLKAIGTGWRNGITFKDIEIINDNLGKPEIKLHGKAKEVCGQLNAHNILVTLSHTKELAIAFVIINNKQT
ncbi:MAG: holo-[acyl-carrier-protein] synthase [Marinilabiliales bacterium]|nr:MAG: holo-[acyl-carrier-protein] synthase [Marinilabiliales bacterium]